MLITVAIPTYNGATRLPEVLDALQGQVRTEGISWEILIIDNNSRDLTEEVISQYQSTIQLRSCKEMRLGAGFARARAFRDARGELVAFLDDDNIPNAHWVSEVALFARNHPRAGAFGSKIHPEYAATPPPNFSRVASLFALTDLGPQPLLYKKKSTFLPPSAGLVVRKIVWAKYVPDRMILTGRVAGNFLTGEDLEMLGYIQATPWEIWYNPAMQITHKIPAARLQREYLIPFVRGVGHSRYVTRTSSIRGVRKHVFTIGYLANDLKRIIFCLLKYRTKVKTDLVAACEFQFLLSTFTSPFFLWRKGYRRR